MSHIDHDQYERMQADNRRLAADLASAMESMDEMRRACLAVAGYGPPTVHAAVPLGVESSYTPKPHLRALTDQAKQIVELATDHAERMNDHWVGPEHILISLSLSQGVAGEIMRGAGLDLEACETMIRKARETWARG